MPIDLLLEDRKVAPDRHEVIFTRNATEAINLVSYSWGRKNIGRGDAIVLTEMEHHANLVPWQLLVQERDGDLEFIPITDDGILRQDVYDVLLRPLGNVVYVMPPYCIAGNKLDRIYDVIEESLALAGA